MHQFILSTLLLEVDNSNVAHIKHDLDVLVHVHVMLDLHEVVKNGLAGLVQGGVDESVRVKDIVQYLRNCGCGLVEVKNGGDVLAHVKQGGDELAQVRDGGDGVAHVQQGGYELAHVQHGVDELVRV